jgi:hypothetical protein
MFDEHYIRFFVESGYDVVKLHRIDCPTTLAIAMVDEATIRTALQNLSDEGAEAIVQVGTDLVMTHLADEAERWLGKPVLSVNATMLWHALRANNIEDRLFGLVRSCVSTERCPMRDDVLREVQVYANRSCEFGAAARRWPTAEALVAATRKAQLLEGSDGEVLAG